MPSSDFILQRNLFPETTTCPDDIQLEIPHSLIPKVDEEANCTTPSFQPQPLENLNILFDGYTSDERYKKYIGLNVFGDIFSKTNCIVKFHACRTGVIYCFEDKTLKSRMFLCAVGSDIHVDHSAFRMVNRFTVYQFIDGCAARPSEGSLATRGPSPKKTFFGKSVPLLEDAIEIDV